MNTLLEHLVQDKGPPLSSKLFHNNKYQKITVG